MDRKSLKVNETHSNFSFKDHDGKEIKLSNLKKLIILLIILSIFPLFSSIKAKTTYSLILLKEKPKKEINGLEFIKELSDGYLYLYSGSSNLNIPYTFIRNIREDATGYNTYQSIKEKLNLYAENYKDITELKTIGKTYEGRDIIALKISKKDGLEKFRILVVGCHHAREWMSVEIPMKIVDYLISNYDKDEVVKSWIDNFEIWVIPILNPDGHEYSVLYDRMWRKNRVINYDGSRGVDNNRNYGYKWGLSDGSSSNPSSETYRGKSPFSELENIAIRDFVYENPVSFALSYHSFSELILYPWGYTSEPPPDKDLFEEIALNMAKTTGPPNDDDFLGPYDYYPMQSSLLYPTSGDLTDFLYGEMGTLAFTIELNSTKEFFDPPPELIEPTWEETKGIFFVAMNYVDKVGLLSLNVVDKDGNPFSGDVNIIEKNIKRKTQKSGVFNYFLPSGEYTISVGGVKRKVKIENGKKNLVLINLGEIKVNPSILDFGVIDLEDKLNFEFEVEGEGKIETEERVILSKYDFSGKDKILGFIDLNGLERDREYVFKIKLIGKSDTKEVEIRFKFIKDITPPNIKFNIEDGFITNKKYIQIIGETEKDAKIIFNGNELKLDEFNRFYIDFELNEGENSLIFTAIDKFGNTKEYNLKIICDTTPPSIELNIPEVYKTKEDGVLIKGLSSEKVEVFVNGEEIGIIDGGSFEISINLNKDLNKFDFEFEDLAKNKIKLIRTIYKVEEKIIELYIGKDEILINGTYKKIDSPPFIKNVRTYVPIRFITEALGGNIVYNEKDKSISFTLYDSSVLMFVNEKKYFVNFEEKFMDSPPILVPPGRVMIPVRFVAESLGAKLLWDPQLKKITIIYPDF